MKDKFDFNQEVRNKLFACQLGFYKASIDETFYELKMDALLRTAQNAVEIAQQLQLNHDAIERFLNAAASLSIIIKNENDTYIFNPLCERYTSTNCLSLVWLIKNKIADFMNFNPISEKEIKSKYGEDVLNRFNALVEASIISKDAQLNYYLSDGMADYLVSTSPRYIGPIISHYETVMFPMFNKKGLLGALKTGKSQWHEIFGNEVSTPFDLYKKEPQLIQIFTEGLHNLNKDDDAIHAENLDLDGVENILDIGGGSGAWSIQLLRKSKHIEEICIYELPEAIPLLNGVLNKYAPSESRIKYVPGSFFSNINGEYLEGFENKKTFDLISLCWILHDWNDATNIQILRKARSHLKQDGRLVILETLLPDNKVGTTNILDLTMLLQTEGRERTFNEYKKLIQQAGFREVCWRETNTRRQMLIAKK